MTTVGVHPQRRLNRHQGLVQVEQGAQGPLLVARTKGRAVFDSGLPFQQGAAMYARLDHAGRCADLRSWLTPVYLLLDAPRCMLKDAHKWDSREAALWPQERCVQDSMVAGVLMLGVLKQSTPPTTCHHCSTQRRGGAAGPRRPLHWGCQSAAGAASKRISLRSCSCACVGGRRRA